MLTAQGQEHVARILTEIDRWGVLTAADVARLTSHLRRDEVMAELDRLAATGQLVIERRQVNRTGRPNTLFARPGTELPGRPVGRGLAADPVAAPAAPAPESRQNGRLGTFVSRLLRG